VEQGWYIQVGRRREEREETRAASSAIQSTGTAISKATFMSVTTDTRSFADAGEQREDGVVSAN
jgi:hypothetical protein